MNIKDILSDNARESIPLLKIDNYSNIYKKTEKIVCVVFLMTDEGYEKSHNKESIEEVRVAAKDFLRTVITALSLEVSEASGSLRGVIRQGTLLRSLLQVLVAARVLRADLIDVVVREIDGVIYNAARVWDERREGMNAGLESLPEYLHSERKRPRAPQHERRLVAPSVGSQKASEGESRRDAILTIIRQREVVSIKDISDSIKDCSEKTIQRELIELIKDNLVIKEGERRWSKYRILNTAAIS